MQIYKIYDKLKSDYWETPKGKKFWLSPEWAKIAWYGSIRSPTVHFDHPFQTRYIIHTFDVVRNLGEEK